MPCFRFTRVRRLTMQPVLAALAAAPLQAQTAYPATLACHALLPAQSFMAAPKDAPQDLRNAGKFTTGKRVEALGTVQGLSAGRPTGVSRPFNGQPLQGHSGITPGAPGGVVDFQVRRSKGFEGMASSKDGSKLYALLEGALWDTSTKGNEKLDGRDYLRVLEFDVKSESWTGRH